MRASISGWVSYKKIIYILDVLRCDFFLTSFFCCFYLENSCSCCWYCCVAVSVLNGRCVAAAALPICLRFATRRPFVVDFFSNFFCIFFFRCYFWLLTLLYFCFFVFVFVFCRSSFATLPLPLTLLPLLLCCAVLCCAVLCFVQHICILWINKEFSLGFSHVYRSNWMLYGFSLIEVVKKSTSSEKFVCYFITLYSTPLHTDNKQAGQKQQQQQKQQTDAPHTNSQRYIERNTENDRKAHLKRRVMS